MVAPLSNKALVQSTLKNISNARSKISTSIGRLASGRGILKASDNAAGLALSARLHSDIQALQKGVESVSQGIRLTNIAEGGLKGITRILSEAKSLAVQASSGTLSDAQRTIVNKQFNSLMTDIDRIAGGTEFNGTKLLSGALDNNSAEFNVQVGTENNEASKINLNIIPNVSSESLQVKTLDLSTQSSAQEAIGSLESALQQVLDIRGSVGSVQNRFSSVAETQKNQIQQFTQAESNISDADYAAEISRLRQSEIQLNSSIQALKQSQFSTQNLGSLLNITT